MSTALDIICGALTLVFFWSTCIVLLGLVARAKRYPHVAPKLRFAVLICARNEESVIRLPVKSVLMSKYPAAMRDVIVLANECTDATAALARKAGAIVWEKPTPSSGKGEVLAWGVDRVRESGKYDAVAVFDADNVVSDVWLDVANDALCGGETVVTGCRHASNSEHGFIPGWYTVYWDMMNELSNRVRTNLQLSGKLTGTGFAFLLSALGPEGWKTSTMVEDVEFTVQSNLHGARIAYLPLAEYADEQPESVSGMWRQLRRWATGGWQVVARYFKDWVRTMVRNPSFRLFDSFFAILTGMSVAFVHLTNVITLIAKLSTGVDAMQALEFFVGIFGFVFLMGWLTGYGAVALSSRKRMPRWYATATFPIFSLILSASVLYTLILPTRKWKPIEHIGRKQDYAPAAS